MTEEQLQALNQANQAPEATPEATPEAAPEFTPLDQDALYKVVGGDWGNSYGKIKDQTAQAVTVYLIGQGVAIEVQASSLLAVPFIGF